LIVSRNKSTLPKLRQEDAALLADLNKALDSMRKDGTEKAIRQRWFGEHFQ